MLPDLNTEDTGVEIPEQDNIGFEKEPVFTPEKVTPVSTEEPASETQQSVREIPIQPYFRSEEFTKLNPMARLTRNFGEIVGRQTSKYTTDPNIIKALLLTESDANPYATSSAGAKGLGQLTDITVEQIKKIMGDKFPKNFDSYDPEHAVEGMTVYWNWIKSHPGVRRAVKSYKGDPNDIYLAAYNAGPGVVSKNNGLPEGYAETDTHRNRFYNYYNKLKKTGGVVMEHRLDKITEVMLGIKKKAISQDIYNDPAIMSDIGAARAAPRGIATGSIGIDAGGTGTQPPGQVFPQDFAPERTGSSSNGFGDMSGVGMLLAAGLVGGLLHHGGGKVRKSLGKMHPIRRMTKSLDLFKPFKDYEAKVMQKAFKNPKEQANALAEVIKVAETETNYLRPEVLTMLKAQHQNLVGAAPTSMFSKYKNWLPETPSQALMQIGGVGLAAKAPDIVSNIFGGEKRKGITIS